MESIVVKGYAKINIGLDVLRRREDGYHEVRMIMQTIDIFDTLTLTKCSDPGIFLTVNIEGLEADERNLAYKAAKLLMDEKWTGGEYGLAIHLEKHIPMAAGLAGGSADAAAVLKGVNELFELGASLEELERLGAKLGADIPYCVMEGTALAEGIGEILTPVKPCPECFVLISKPPIDVPTKFVYGNLHANELLVHADIDGLLEAIDSGDAVAMAGRMGNVLETVTVSAYPVIDEIKKMMMECGALGSMMSGSGPTVFGIFDSMEKAEAAAEVIRKAGISGQTEAAALHRSSAEL